MWSFDGVKLSEPAEPIPFRLNERVRVTLINDTVTRATCATTPGGETGGGGGATGGGGGTTGGGGATGGGTGGGKGGGKGGGTGGGGGNNGGGGPGGAVTIPTPPTKP